jgi:hypothetical protein
MAVAQRSTISLIATSPLVDGDVFNQSGVRQQIEMPCQYSNMVLYLLLGHNDVADYVAVFNNAGDDRVAGADAYRDNDVGHLNVTFNRYSGVALGFRRIASDRQDQAIACWLQPVSSTQQARSCVVPCANKRHLDKVLLMDRIVGITRYLHWQHLA